AFCVVIPMDALPHTVSDIPHFRNDGGFRTNFHTCVGCSAFTDALQKVLNVLVHSVTVIFLLFPFKERTFLLIAAVGHSFPATAVHHQSSFLSPKSNAVSPAVRPNARI